MISTVLNGLAFGGLVFLLASGLTVIFGLMDVLNLAHGSFYMLGAYAALALGGLTHSFWPALLLAPLLVGAIGAGLEVVFFRRLYRQGHLIQVLLTFGFSLIFVDLVRWRFGPETHSIPAPPGLEGAVTVAGVPFATYKLFVIAVAGLVATGILFAWRRLRAGMQIRAGVTDRRMLAMLGVDLAPVFTITFAAGAALAGLAGVVVGPYLSVYPGMDEHILLLALVVVVIGGLGSIEGAIAGSLLAGLATAAGPILLRGFDAAAIFALMVMVLVIRPRGLFGLRQ